MASEVAIYIAVAIGFGKEGIVVCQMLSNSGLLHMHVPVALSE